MKSKKVRRRHGTDIAITEADCPDCDGKRHLFFDPYYDAVECDGTCGYRELHPIGD